MIGSIFGTCNIRVTYGDGEMVRTGFELAIVLLYIQSPVLPPLLTTLPANAHNPLLLYPILPLVLASSQVAHSHPIPP
jgi:hypothetical protein